LPFHPLPEPFCQLAFSSTFPTFLSSCLFILFPNLSVSLPFHPFSKACLFPWFTSLSVNMQCILLSLSSENEKCLAKLVIFILMQKVGSFSFETKTVKRSDAKNIFGSDTKNGT
jgi:hypothetical protein